MVTLVEVFVIVVRALELACRGVTYSGRLPGEVVERRH
jgi:hypothetical protein